MRFLFLLLVSLDLGVSVHLTKGSDDFKIFVFLPKIGTFTFDRAALQLVVLGIYFQKIWNKLRSEMFFEFSTTLLLQVIMVVSTIIGSMLSRKYLIVIVLFFEKHHCKAIIWCTQARNKVGITSNVVVGHMIIETTDF